MEDHNTLYNIIRYITLHQWLKTIYVLQCSSMSAISWRPCWLAKQEKPQAVSQKYSSFLPDACAAHSPLKTNRIIFGNRNLLFDWFICYFCTLQTPSKQMPSLSPQTFLNPQPDIYQGNKRAQVVPVFIHWRPTMVNKQGEWKTNPAVCSQIHPVQYNPQTEAFCCVGLTAGCGGITVPYLHRPVSIKYSSHKKHKKGKRSSECASAKAQQRGKL